MIKINTKIVAILFASFTLFSCGESSSSEKSSKKKDKGDAKVDVCKCLTMPGDSEYMQENNDACRDAISEAIDVDNWEKVNMSQDREASAKFDELARRCQVR
jgi:hypothetical protein